MKLVTEKRTWLPRNGSTAPARFPLSRRRVSFAALDRGHAELVEELHVRLWAAPSASPVPRQRLAKRIVDIVLATAALVVLAPVLLAIAALIRFEDRSSPVLFRQRRCGYEGREFELLKFRTMVRDADHLKEQLRSRSTVPWPDFRLPDDPRVTTVGRVLRRTSADELPQLINVLRGEMSLVGPRPTSFKANTYELWQTERLEFRPGITGPWQISGRDTMDFEERCRLEIRFFREATLWRELRLLGATGMTVVRRTGVA